MISKKLTLLTFAAAAGFGALAFNVELASAGGYGGGQGGRSSWSGGQSRAAWGGYGGGQGNRRVGAPAKAKPTGAAKATKVVGAAAKADPLEAAMAATKAAEAVGAAFKALSGQ
jgi:hypothetical protein